MAEEIEITAADARSPSARMMADALWAEIQERYGFEAADNPMELDAMATPPGGFWLALDNDVPVGSAGLVVRDTYAELDAVYVAPSHRRRGIGSRLLQQIDEHALATGQTTLRLRAGDPQPEALELYRRYGYVEIPAFDHWADDPSAVCFEKRLASRAAEVIQALDEQRGDWPDARR